MKHSTFFNVFFSIKRLGHQALYSNKLFIHSSCFKKLKYELAAAKNPNIFHFKILACKEPVDERQIFVWK